MNFDVIISNPPYNNDIYIDFSDYAFRKLNVGGEMVFITPAKWNSKGDDKNNDFRDRTLPYMDKVVFYPVCYEVFSEALINGGVSIYHINKDIESSSIDIRSEKVSLISGNKVISKSDFRGTLFITVNTIVNKFSHGERLRVARVSDRWYESENYLITGDLFSWGGIVNQQGQTFVLHELKHWNGLDKISNDSMLFGETYIEAEVESMKSYVNTRVVRFLVWLRCSGMHCGQEYTWRFVPAPENLNTIWTDKMLYDKYGLSDKEIEIIESIIKERS